MVLDAAFLLPLVVKMLVSAGIVVAASLIAERAGPMIAALVATLPVSAGPSYFFLSLAHEPAFIAQAAIGSVLSAVGSVSFALAYATTAQRHGLIVSLFAALATWFAVAYASSFVAWTWASALAVALLVYPLALLLARPLRNVPMPPPRRRWYDIPLRASMVATLVLVVVSASAVLGPHATGLLAAFPVVFTSLILILHPRAGGRPTGAVMAHSVVGMIGFALALLVLHATAVPLGSSLALTLALAICIGWNLMLFFLRTREPS